MTEKREQRNAVGAKDASKQFCKGDCSKQLPERQRNTP